MPRAAGWRLAGRLSLRSVRARPGSSVLVVALVALPVAIAIAVAALQRTAVPSAQQFASGYLGRADAQLSPAYDDLPATARELSVLTVRAERAAGPGARAVPDLRLGAQFSPAPPGAAGDLVRVAGALRLVDLADPMSEGMYRLAAGRLPGPVGEAVISTELARRLRLAPGQPLWITGTSQRLVVTGLVVDRQDTTALLLVAPPGDAAVDAALALDRGAGTATPLVSITLLARVEAIDRAVPRWEAGGFSVSTRERVMLETEHYIRNKDPSAPTLAVLAVALAELGLLIGAAFTMVAHQRRRELALLAAAGARRADRLRVILVEGLVLGACGGALAVPIGAGIGWLAIDPMSAAAHQEWSVLRLDPQVTLIGPLLGCVVAVLAALVSGRRAAWSPPMTALRLALPSRRAGRSPVAAVVAVASAGVLLGWAVVRANAVTAVLGTLTGAIALVTAGLSVLPGLRSRGERLPFSLRSALRDAAADAGRAVALTSAIAAPFLVTVLAMSLLGGKAVQARREYVPNAPPGAAVFTGPRAPTGAQLANAATALGATSVAQFVQAGQSMATAGGSVVLPVVADNPTLQCIDATGGAVDAESMQPRVQQCVRSGGGADPFARVSIARAGIVELLLGRPLSTAERTAFAAGTALALDSRVVQAGEIRMRVMGYNTGGERAAPGDRRLPALLVPTPRAYRGLPAVVVAAEAAARTGLQPLSDHGALFLANAEPSTGQEDRARAVLDTGDGTSSLTVERGPQGERMLTRILVVVGLGLFLATLAVVGVSVALSTRQLRQDFATLAAVGASRRVRRRLSGVQAGALALVGVIAGVFLGTVGAAVLAIALDDPLWPRVWWGVALIGATSVICAGAVGALSAPRRLSLTRRLT